MYVKQISGHLHRVSLLIAFYFILQRGIGCTLVCLSHVMRAEDEIYFELSQIEISFEFRKRREGTEAKRFGG